MTSLEIPMNDESTSHMHSSQISSSTEPTTHNTQLSSSATSSLIVPAQPPSQATSWIRMDFTNEETSGAEQMELRKLDSFEVEHKEKETPAEQLPLSPPLTRVPTTDSTSVRILTPPLENEESQGLEEVDIVEWYPLARPESSAKVDSLSLHDLDIGSETDKRPRRRTNRKPAHLNLEFREPSPQPWDVIDPPLDSDHVEAGCYSPVRSPMYASQRTGRRRPLIPHSSYYYGPPPSDSAYGTSPVGQIGVHHPREIVRIERDYGGGELTQFSSIYPIELDGRITPTQFMETINDINELLISAHSVRHSFIYNFLAVATLHLSTLFITSHYDKEMRRLKQKIERINTQIYNPVGLNILWPRNVAFLFVSIFIIQGSLCSSLLHDDPSLDNNS
ncbi:Golgin subfamily A member 7/ERF4 family-domain-containing protein [Suillus subalutaceus]|uniref:Golgin subfamily A member 7/ERF4 family-domain-containing protein n=1 Tax=Suillus subalutaceus TaxID=48586 RepID=UPI001B86BD0D|nr:Golgin subfamily A member 7/ERF4 family-domain-containing protein [Suillus subalutaceus]KAG1845095.1 Golgin subfamily A member 7/ERF4 family-domain-containing protein [Suillus subalutaceus]